ncbi:MAG: hypothetical protein ACKVUS_12655 [Saprospiraceae bacterium]
MKGLEIRDSTGRFVTSRGVAIGDSLSKVEKIYGKPRSRIIDLGNDGSVFWIWHGLFYKDLMFFTDSTGLNVKGFLVGKYP